MLEVLRIVASSWPIAVMALGTIAGGIVLYFIRWIKQSNRDDKAHRAAQAMVVRDR